MALLERGTPFGGWREPVAWTIREAMRLVPGPIAATFGAAMPGPVFEGSSVRDPVLERDGAAAYVLLVTLLGLVPLLDGSVALDPRLIGGVLAAGALAGLAILRFGPELPQLLAHACAVVVSLVVGAVALIERDAWPVAALLLVPLALWLATFLARREALGQVAVSVGCLTGAAYAQAGVVGAAGYGALTAGVLVGCVVMVTRLRTGVAGSIATSEEAIERQRAEGESRLRATEARYRKLIEALPLVTYATGLDGDGAMRYVSPQIDELAGCQVAEWTIDAWMNAIHADDRERVLAARRYHLQTGQPHRIEYRLLRPDGRELWILDEASIEVDRSGGTIGSRGYLQDITERRRLEEQLAHRALHDPLTGLPNRTLLLERLNHWASRRAPDPLAVLYVDLDDFKFVNDRLGHAAGDEVLQEVARRLVLCVRDEDTVARIGGDEFALLLESVDPLGAESVAERVITTVSASPVRVGGNDLAVAVSVGVATSTRPGRATPDVVLNHADMAMYEAKGAGKAQSAVYAVEMGAGAATRQRMRGELARALDEQEFELHFQPIIDLVDRRIVGAEALVRWRHPLHGMVPPAKFIDDAIATGQIVPIGRIVLEGACRAAAEIRERTEVPIWITFNLALRELRERDLVDVIEESLARHGLPPEAMMVEITESAFLPDDRSTTTRLHDLRAMGVRLAIDDFGTGYSSLSYLTRVPADVVKLARPFILSLESEGREATLAQSVIRLCADLGFPTVAEGIETAEQHMLARDLGCPFGQGYLFAKPAPFATLMKAVEAESPAAPGQALAV